MNCKMRAFLSAILVVAALSSCARSAEPLTADEIVSRCAESMGGERGIDALRTLTFRTRPPDGHQPLLWEIERPNLVRKELTGRLILAFDGSRAAFLLAPPEDDGTPVEPHLIVEEDWHHFEMDIALYVPAFFDYQAEYVDTTTVGGSKAHLLRVVLPMGGVAEYAVDAVSYLPVKVLLPDWDLERFLGDYEEENGFMYFHRYWTTVDTDGGTVLENLEINSELDGSRFAIPRSLM